MRLLVVLVAAVGCVVSAPQHFFDPYQSHPVVSHHWVVPGITEGSGWQCSCVIRPSWPSSGVALLSQPQHLLHPQHLDSALPQASAPSGVSALNNPPQAVKYSNAERVRSTLSPLMRLAVDTGVVKPAGSSHTGAPQYIVSPHLAEEVGGVSSLAHRLGAVPVAAVHDVQARPNFEDSETAFAPVLIHQETPQITLYTLEVPIQ